MDPLVGGFAIGLLLGAAKITFIGAVGFGVAWLRARARIRRLEEELELTSVQLQRAIETQGDMARLPGRGDAPTGS